MVAGGTAISPGSVPSCKAAIPGEAPVLTLAAAFYAMDAEALKETFGDARR